VFTTIAEKTLSQSVLDDDAPPRLKTTSRGLCLILGWTFLLDCIYLIAPSADRLTDLIATPLKDYPGIAIVIMLTVYTVPLLCALASGLLLIALTHVFNLHNASRFTSCIRWASLGCVLFSISSVFLFGDPLKILLPTYLSGRLEVDNNFDISMKGSLAGWIFGALLAAFIWWLRRRIRHADVRHDSPFRPLAAVWVPESLPKLGSTRCGEGE